jgi:hypothetical protein
MAMLDRHANNDGAAVPLVPPRAVAPFAWACAIVVLPAALGITIALAMNAHAAITAAVIYIVGLLMWLALRALGGRRESTRSSQLVLAFAVVTAILSDNVAIALTLGMLGLSGIAIAVASWVSRAES